jgi:hypothetical protein
VGPRGLKGLGLAAAILLVIGVAAASAEPPTGVTATQDRGRPVVSWTNPPNATDIDVVVSRLPNRARRVALYLLSAPAQTMRAATPLPPGAYYVSVGTATCEDCELEWSAAVKITIPPLKIVPGRGIANIDVGLPERDVEALLGPVHGTRFSSSTNYTDYSYENKRMWVSFLGRTQHGVVHHVGTSRASLFVGKSRIHVGSTERAVRTALHARCRTYRYFGYPYRECWLGRRAKGAVVTVFDIRRGRVDFIRIGKLRFLNGDPFIGQNS